MGRWSVSEDGLIVSCPSCGQKNRLSLVRLDHRGQCGKCHASLPAPDEPVDVPSEAAFDALISNAALPVVVDFWAPWCGPCRMVAPELARVAHAHAGEWVVAKVNTDALPEVAARFTVRSIPTMITFSRGHVRQRYSGALPAEGIEELLAGSVG
ncbi:MAG: thioredoxin [Acidobacteriota bacterium]